MKEAYPIVLRPTDNGYYVIIPDFDTGTQGDTIAEAMEMARDAIGIVGIDMQDDGEPLPTPNSGKISKEKNDIVTFVDVDFEEYRKKVDNRSVKKNCTIPYWLSVEADKANINYSRILQDALAKTLNLSLNVK
ncbi:MAG: type II toxin-antitoxin system HicB family antitoxin [Butyrivibrio sp.]|nr:type II toxin-antitoxin system HicB family antitoxin [Butyrivibrio sp.]